MLDDYINRLTETQEPMPGPKKARRGKSLTEEEKVNIARVWEETRDVEQTAVACGRSPSAVRDYRFYPGIERLPPRRKRKRPPARKAPARSKQAAAPAAPAPKAAPPIRVPTPAPAPAFAAENLPLARQLLSAAIELLR